LQRDASVLDIRDILVSPFFRCLFVHYFESGASDSRGVTRGGRDARSDASGVPRGCEYPEPTPGTNCASPSQTLREIDNSRVVAQHPSSGYLRLRKIQHASLRVATRIQTQADSSFNEGASLGFPIKRLIEESRGSR